MRRKLQQAALQQPEKTAEISRRHGWFPCEMVSEERAQKFHTDDVSLLYSFLRRHFVGKQVVASRNVGCFLSLFFQLLKMHIKPVPYQKVHQSDSKEKQAQKKEEKSKSREWIQRIVVHFIPLANGAYEG